MLDSKSITNLFPLVGNSVRLCLFTDVHLNSDYVGWLNDSQVVKYSSQRFKKHSLETCSTYFQSFKNTENLFLAIHEKASNKFVGTMTAYFNDHHKVVDIGIMIGDKNSWGKGVGQEAWGMLMTFMFEERKMRKVTGGTLSSNLGMLAVMKKSGMQPDGIRTDHELIDGIPTDVLYFCKFNNE